MNPVPYLSYLPTCTFIGYVKPVNLHSEYNQFPLAMNHSSENNSNKPSASQSLVRFRKAYERRNVYKSIIRHTFKHIQKNKEKIFRLLIRERFTTGSIESAMERIAELAKQENERGKPKGSKKALAEMLQSKTIYAYILKESLAVMIEDWKNGINGKVLQENLQVYKQVCEEFYNRAMELINKSKIN